MSKYVVEGNINFYEELYKSFDEPESQEESTDLCLITNSPLTENFVTLNCNHKFNYDAIYNDIYCHKKKYNSMERCLVKQKEIRCPYCRTIHPSLLPHIEGYPKSHGVNYYDEKLEVNLVNNNCYIAYTLVVCCYVSAPVDNITPKCNTHYVKVLALDGKTYCGMHYRLRTKEIYNANKIKEKMEKKQALMLEKQKIMDEKNKTKLDEKLKKQAEKMNAKVNKIKNENVIISSAQHPTEIDQTKCVQILKSGPNKGKQCGCKIISHSLCGKHNKTKDIPEQQKVIE
jgi:hypothetical protein